MFGFLIILLCFGAFLHCKHTGCHPFCSVNSHQNALDIVRERYARGEISSEEFNERKKALE
ncbi:SHOCT domain-containing protein [Desulfosporosinus sp. Sb-LF]|uniref:SHOCT domain-containing protein n=1 Tax=Desulfosporosinus sp. Sb-LF TaxID=2560027 RepID=UPI00107F354D|nr:SHOCT domain-containing protein [Desulfosporosinus sp. Sb-LF]TGE31150.1 SHOCT domain-containing protein [Desulfosporosinus sp. Sb-LF]